MEPLSKGCPIAARVDASSLMVPACTSALPGLVGAGALRPPGGVAGEGSLVRLAASREGVSGLKLGGRW
jgi:hypothetical protein